MKILLIHPAANIIENRRERKYAAHPLGLAYIAAIAEQDGHEVCIFDALIRDGYNNEEVVRPGFIRYGVSKETIEKKIRDFGPDVVGVSTLHSNRKYEIMEVTEAAKKVSKDIITIQGAGYPSSQPEEALSDPYCDYIVMGEGEYTFRDFLRKVERGDTDFSDLDGFGYKNGEKILINPKQTYVKDLDLLPFPAYHLLDMEAYSEIGTGMGRFIAKKYTLFNGSRGCPHKCHFCGKNPIIGKGYRKRSVNNMIEEIKMLQRDYRIEELQIVDFHAMADRRHWHDFCKELIRQDINITFSLAHGMAIESLDNETLELMYRAGCDHLYMAIESANQVYLDSLGKGIKIEKLHRIIEKAHSLGYTTSGYFVLGVPGEKWKDIVATTELAEKLDLDDACFFIATPLPGTPMYEEIRKKSLFRKEFSTERIRYSLSNIIGPDYSAEDIENLRYEAWFRIRNRVKNRVNREYNKEFASELFYSTEQLMP